jgi:hypothetical protein
MAVEEPIFEIVEHLGEVEIRAYPPLLVAETEVEGEFDQVGNQAFRRLAGYIFGRNRTRAHTGSAARGTEGATTQRTDPVAIGEAPSARIAMTAPVGMRPDEPRAMPGRAGEAAAPEGGRWVMSFTMPKGWTLATLPEPLDPLVRVRESPARTVAVLRFSGVWSAARFAGQEQSLRARLAESGWQAVGPAESLRYDPPWTLWFLRRNEVALPVERAGTGLPGGG